MKRCVQPTPMLLEPAKLSRLEIGNLYQENAIRRKETGGCVEGRFRIRHMLKRMVEDENIVNPACSVNVAAPHVIVAWKFFKEWIDASRGGVPKPPHESDELATPRAYVKDTNAWFRTDEEKRLQVRRQKLHLPSRGTSKERPYQEAQPCAYDQP